MEKCDIAIIASAQDKAGMNIAASLKEVQEFPATIGESKVILRVVEEKITEAGNLDMEIDAEIFVFASRHVSKAGVHSLTVHSIGNWGEAAKGGRSSTLVNAPAALMKKCLQRLDEKVKQEKLDYEVMQEATHHGPFTEKQAMFIEIGSDETRWVDVKAGKLVAETILEAIKTFTRKELKTAVGLGGTHYCTNLKKIMAGDACAIGFVCPKHNLNNLNEGMLGQAMEKTLPKAESVILDWKGLGQEKSRIVSLLESMGIPYTRTKDY